MKLKIFKTLWGHTESLETAISQALSAGFDGLEGPAPDNEVDAERYRALLSELDLSFIAEITTAGAMSPTAARRCSSTSTASAPGSNRACASIRCSLPAWAAATRGRKT